MRWFVLIFHTFSNSYLCELSTTSIRSSLSSKRQNKATSRDHSASQRSAGHESGSGVVRVRRRFRATTGSRLLTRRRRSRRATRRRVFCAGRRGVASTAAPLRGQASRGRLSEAAVIRVREEDRRAAGLRGRARDTGVFGAAAAGREAGGKGRARDFEVGADTTEGVVVFTVGRARAAVRLRAAVIEVHLVVGASVAI